MCPESQRQTILSIQQATMIFRLAVRGHTRGESLGECEDSFRFGASAKAPALGLKPLLKRSDYYRRQALSSQLTKLRGELVSPWILEVQTHSTILPLSGSIAENNRTRQNPTRHENRGSISRDYSPSVDLAPPL